MGGGGGGTFHGRSPKTLATRVRDAELVSIDKEFESELSKTLSDLLAQYNDRDAEAIRKKIDRALDCLTDEIEGDLKTLFGGSVAKHTYVDGLSDVDSLLVLNDSELVKRAPSNVLTRLTTILQNKLASEATVEQGKVAVTLKFRDGTEIQLVPAVKTKEGLKVPAWRENRWSDVNPEAFSAALTRHNERHGKSLIPTIKLAKAVNSGLPEKQQLSGYHIEALAIEAFRGYDGPRTPAFMLPHFFSRASNLVLSPLKDKTGQSFHVDDYLGSASSKERQSVAHVLDRVAKRMRNASAGKDMAQWWTLF